jgi:signal transduction histidine kinase
LLNTDSRFVVGKPLALYVGSNDRQRMRRALHTVASSAEVSTFELRVHPQRSAESVWTEAGVRRVSSIDGSSAALCWSLHEPQQRSSHASEQIDARAEQIERELSEERRCRIDAEHALARHQDVLAFVVHELRNPLTATAGWLQILNEEDHAGAPRPKVFEVLTRNVKTLARMVDELVDQTRVVQDQITLECEPTDLCPLLERICDDMRGVALAKQQSLSCELASDLVPIHCDAFRIQEALANLVGNAFKFTPAEGSVQLSARRLDDLIEICVHDNGPGLAPEQLTRIFEPFIRINARGSSTGLGLGLSIARRLIELHSGTIRAESEGMGRGATFRVCLPVAGPGTADHHERDERARTGA